MDIKKTCLANFLNVDEQSISVVVDNSIYSVKLQEQYRVLTESERDELFEELLFENLHKMTAESILSNVTLVDENEYFSNSDLVSLVDQITDEYGKNSLPLLMQLIGDKEEFLENYENDHEGGKANLLSMDHVEHRSQTFNLYIYRFE